MESVGAGDDVSYLAGDLERRYRRGACRPRRDTQSAQSRTHVAVAPRRAFSLAELGAEPGAELGAEPGAGVERGGGARAVSPPSQ